MTTRPVRINFLPTALVVLALVVLAFFLDALMVEVFAFLLGVAVAIVLYPIMRFLRDRLHLPHVMAVALTVILFFAFVIGLLVIVVPAVAREAQNFQQLLTQIRQNPQSVQLFNQVPGLNRLLGPEEVQTLVDQLSTASSTVTGGLADFTKRIVQSLAYIFFAILTMVFVLGGAHTLSRGLLRATPVAWREPLARTLGRIQHDVGLWGLWTVVIAVITGLVSWLGFMLFGVQNAALYAVIQGIGELFPDVGPFLAGAFVFLALLVIDPTKAFLALLVVIVVQGAMAFIEPLVFHRTVRIHPALTVLGILLLGSAFGIIGALLAVPILAVLKIAFEEFYVDRLPDLDQDRMGRLLHRRDATNHD